MNLTSNIAPRYRAAEFNSNDRNQVAVDTITSTISSIVATQTSIGDLPDELLLMLFAYLKPKELLTYGLVSKKWRTISQEEQLWNAFSMRNLHMGTVQQVVTFSGHLFWVKPVTFSPDGQRMLTRCEERTRTGNRRGDYTVRLWNLKGEMLAVLKKHLLPITSATFAPDGQAILTASEDGTVRLWDSEGKDFTVLDGHTHGTATFAPDNQRILTSSTDGTALLRDRKGQSMISLKGHSKPLYSAIFSPDGKEILTASADKTVRLWDCYGNTLAVLKCEFNSKFAIFAPDGQAILTLPFCEKEVYLWHRSKKEFKITVLKGHSKDVNSAIFSPDGQKILTTSDDKTARLWDRQGQLLFVLEGHTDSVLSADFAPDGRTILTASYDDTVRLWNLQGKEITVLFNRDKDVYNRSRDICHLSKDMRNRNNVDGINWALFAPHGQAILIGDRANIVHLF